MQFVTELCLKWKEFFFFWGNMLFNCLKWKAIFLLGTYWVCVSEREKERCWCWGIKVITYSCFFFFGKYIITEFSSSSSFLLRMVLVDQGDDLFLPFFFFLISTLLLNSRPLPFFCSLSFLLHLLQVRVTVKQMIHLNSELYALQFQVFLLIPSYV